MTDQIGVVRCRCAAVQVALIAGMNFLGAFVQASTGFGYALIAMPLMALLLPMASCSAISAVTIVVIGLQMSLKLRAHLKVGTILVPMLCCFASINAGLYFLSRFDELLLRLILSVLLVGVTTVSFLMRRTKVKRMYGRWPFAVAAGLLTGLSAGMFNVVGPFLMLYYLHVVRNARHEGKLNSVPSAVSMPGHAPVCVPHINSRWSPYGASMAAQSCGYVGLVSIRIESTSSTAGYILLSRDGVVWYRQHEVMVVMNGTKGEDLYGNG